MSRFQWPPHSQRGGGGKTRPRPSGNYFSDGAARRQESAKFLKAPAWPILLCPKFCFYFGQLIQGNESKVELELRVQIFHAVKPKPKA